MKLRLCLLGYDRSRRVSELTEEVVLTEGQHDLTLGDGCTVHIRARNDGPLLRAQVQFTFTRPTALASSVAVRFIADGWRKENYVFAPAAVYDGNRFLSLPLPYPPYAQETEGKLDAPTVITDIPRLSGTAAQSKIELRSGDMSTPAIGYYDWEEKKGHLLFTSHMAGGDYTGLSVYEDLDKQSAAFQVTSPAVREQTKYFFGEKADGSGFYPHTAPSDDTGRWFAAGDTVLLPFAIYQFDAEDLASFFARFHEQRTCIEAGSEAACVPYSKAYETVKAKYQRENFTKEIGGGYYCVGVRPEVPEQCWQAGWVGGGMNYYTFMLEDKGAARERALSTFRYIFDRFQMENGWIAGMYANGVFYGDTFYDRENNPVLLVRKDADLLYFVLKEYLLCKNELAGYAGKIRALADAFVRFYRKNGQLGQFIDMANDRIVIAGSACGAMAPGALSLAYEVFGDTAYLETAEALAELYVNDYLHKGLINGTPGEIAQAPDSEGAFGLLESLVQLYETTGKERWLRAAQEAFELADTWVMSYDFTFPAESAAAKRGAHTTGTVFANAQNKHSAPGICTLSGNSLLKLYRFTGNETCLSALAAISRALMQFVSLPERPVFTLSGKYLPAGYVNERVQTSDWEGKETIGGFLYGSNWPEVCVLLTYGEVPGVYVDLHAGKAFALDSVLCGINECAGDRRMALWIENPTAYEATVTVMGDLPTDRDAVKHNYFSTMQKIVLAPGERKNITVCAE